MLFELATWHALAKLRLHSETTLHIFEHATRTLGDAMREFLRKVCPDYDTKELPKETASRQRRKAAQAAKRPPLMAVTESTAAAANTQNSVAPSTKSTPKLTAKRKRFDLNTYKFHRLGDYPRCIREVGTTDGWTTQTVSIQANHDCVH